ncbi:hypothetical protein AMK59_3539 [Oryctes borbonicus]|uniref:Uncharacterized protein n=1 Tax=Oryctes borbonicus TaxID=1629725 RepID=A0A0T6B7C9_9SCAR|nr:hypothetical protein AMK59_3539 [Oryctes borbonicus]
MREPYNGRSRTRKFNIIMKPCEHVGHIYTPDKRRFRSMSDGSPALPISEQPFEVFPSLPDSVLEKMGLLGDSPKERLNDEESEQKFVALALAFSIDAMTINDRCQRQRRYRDQTEKNLTTEIDRLIDRIYRLQPLCVDAETTEMLTDLLTQVDIVVRAAAYASISSERYGAVQHEERLTQAVEVMIKHVTLLKQQRDSARKHLQYTKRMLQNTNNLNEVQTLPKAKGMHSRRASIAIINQQSSTPKTSAESKRITRRTSEMSIRASALPRSSRPSRLELGVELNKIKEGTAEETPCILQDEHLANNKEIEVENGKPPQFKGDQVEEVIPADFSALPLRQKLAHKIQKIRGKTATTYRKWCDNGKIHEIFFMATMLCFSLSIITLSNILVELEYARNGVSNDYSWSFDNLWTNFFPHIGNNYQQKETLT